MFCWISSIIISVLISDKLTIFYPSTTNRYIEYFYHTSTRTSTRTRTRTNTYTSRRRQIYSILYYQERAQCVLKNNYAIATASRSSKRKQQLRRCFSPFHILLLCHTGKCLVWRKKRSVGSREFLLFNKILGGVDHQVNDAYAYACDRTKGQSLPLPEVVDGDGIAATIFCRPDTKQQQQQQQSKQQC